MKKRAMAIPIVLILATVLGLISTFMLKSQQQYNKSNKTSFAQLQTYFVARAGVQHAMLKIKYLHRELYDAICLSQGRNPLFDFSLINSGDMKTPYKAIKSYNPGPIFLYGQGQYANDGVFTPNFNKTDCDKWLKSFMADINSNTDDLAATEYGKANLVLDLNKLDSKITGLMSEPFQKASYLVSSLNIAAQNIDDKTSKVENNAIVELVINSAILTARQESWQYQIKKTVKITRD